MDHIQAAKAAADTAFRQKEYTIAVCKYDESIQLSEQHRVLDVLHLLYSNRSAAKLALQDYVGALADSQAAVAVDETWVKGWYRSAKALQGLGRYELAVQAAQRALQLQPGNAQVQSLLKELDAWSSSSRRDGRKDGSSSNASSLNTCHPQQQQQQQSKMPLSDSNSGQLRWSHINKLRSQLQVQLLPHQLVQGSEFVSSADGINANLLLLLHGLGDKPAAFTALARQMRLPQTASLALSGPLIVPETGGGRSWFTAYDEELHWEQIQPSPGEKRRIKSLAATVDLVQQQLLPALAAAAAGCWRPDQIFVLGFSQGGSVALELARRCRGDHRLGGVIAVSASLLEEQLWKETADHNSSSSSSSDGSGTDVLITHGDLDNVVSRESVTRTVSLLQRAGCHVGLKIMRNKAHTMINSAEEMRVCMQFWAARLRFRPADDGYEEVPAAAAAAVKQDLMQ